MEIECATTTTAADATTLQNGHVQQPTLEEIQAQLASCSTATADAQQQQHKHSDADGDEDEVDRMLARTHMHVFVLSDAGKPIYTRYFN